MFYIVFSLLLFGQASHCPWTGHRIHCGENFSHWKMRLHFHVFICVPCSSAHHVLESRDGLWHSADTTNTFFIRPLAKKEQQMLNTGDSECVWEWKERLMPFQSLYVWQWIKKRIESHGVYTSGSVAKKIWSKRYSKDEDYILNFHFLLTCIVVFLIICLLLLLDIY